MMGGMMMGMGAMTGKGQHSAEQLAITSYLSR